MALICLLVTPCSPMGLSPSKILYSRPFLLNHYLPDQTPLLAGYLPYLFLLRFPLSSHVDSGLPDPKPVSPNAPEHVPLSPGTHQATSSCVSQIMIDRTPQGNPYHPFGCQASKTLMLLPHLQAQAGTYSGFLVCPKARTLHPLVF